MSSGVRRPRRLVVFGVTGQIGQELVDRLDESGWPIGSLVGVASDESLGATFEFRGETLDVASDWPVLKGCDLVFVCTPSDRALEIVRECLRAEVPCIDLSGALAGQAEVPVAFEPMPARSARASTVGEEPADALAEAPLLVTPSATSLAWWRVLSAIAADGGPAFGRLVGTVLTSAAAHGRRGVASLSEESIALFNQTASPAPGPAGQAVAFDVVPGGGFDPERVRSELARGLGDGLRIGVSAVQVPTFVGEGSSLAIELAAPLSRTDLEARLDRAAGVIRVEHGPGLRGPAVVDPEGPEPIGPTLRDAAGGEDVLVGRIEPDPSLAVDQGWRVWISVDPIGLCVAHALRLAEVRLGLA